MRNSSAGRTHSRSVLPERAAQDRESTHRHGRGGARPAAGSPSSQGREKTLPPERVMRVSRGGAPRRPRPYSQSVASSSPSLKASRRDLRRCMLVTVRGVFDQFPLGQLKALGLSPAGLLDRLAPPCACARSAPAAGRRASPRPWRKLYPFRHTFSRESLLVLAAIVAPAFCPQLRQVARALSPAAASRRLTSATKPVVAAELDLARAARPCAPRT